MDKPREECGVFGVYGPRGSVQGAYLTYLGLYALQHRGQESAGIAVGDGERMRLHKGMGLVADVFDGEILDRLPGFQAVGHVRYSTSGRTLSINAQPMLVQCSHGMLALVHNGNLTNGEALKEELLAGGSVFQTTTDSEIIINLVARYGDDLLRAIEQTYQKLEGAFAVVGMTNQALFGWRDPLGIRPLAFGKLPDGTYLLASESCALTSLGAEEIREIGPGELVIIDEEGPQFYQLARSNREAFCVFEYVYFARQDSILNGRNVHEIRKALGRQLAREQRSEADLVIAAPDSGTSPALGFAQESGIPFEIGLVKNRYVGRTFIRPTPQMRALDVQIKMNPIEAILKDRRVVIIDDSIVRGTTSVKTVQMLREAGVREILMYIASPPYVHPCYYGIDTPSTEDLLATNRTVEEIREYIGADKLAYLSLEGLIQAVGMAPDQVCTACFSGEYPHLDKGGY
jgi:amidophosphoribosyltransferase